MSGVGVPKRKRRWIWWVVLAVVAVAVAAVTLPGLLTSSSTDTGYTTGTVTRMALTATVSGTGSLAVSGVTQVQPGITGTVEDLSVKLGDTVKAGETLFTLVNDDLDAAVTRAKASYQQAKQQVQQAKISLTQAKNDLYKVQHPSSIGTAPAPAADASAVTVAKQKVTLASMGVTSANLGLSSASTSLKQAEDNADKRTVTAPVGGLVTVLNAQNGQSLSGGGSSSTSAGGMTSGSTGAVEISDLGTLQARVQVNEVDLVKIKLGQKASVSFDALPGSDASGTVSAISPTGTSTQGVVTYDVDLTLTTIDPRLRPNMSCTVDIIVATKDSALVVPTSALRTDATTKQKYVLLVSGQQTQRADVTTGLVVGTNTEVLNGLTEGQEIVTTSATSSSTGTGSGNDERGGGMGGIGAMMGGGR
jgi:HlyD family secretion protein